jgi:hypothetical protein
MTTDVAVASVRTTRLPWISAVWWHLRTWWLPSVFAPWLITRAALLLVAELASLTIPHSTADGPVMPATSVDWAAPLLKWDAVWYMRIADGWYQYSPLANPTEGQSVAFFPLYPFLVRLANTLMGGSAATLPVSALLVASVSALVGISVLYRLVEHEFGASLASRTVWYFLIFPVSFYLTAAYAEPTFLAATVIAIYAARTGRWWLAGVAGAAAALCRPYGVLIMLPLAFEYFWQARHDPRGAVRLPALGLAFPAVALLGWMAYLNSLSGDPLVFVKVQSAWDGQQVSGPLGTLISNYTRTRDQQLNGKFDLRSLQFAIAVLGVVGSIIAWRTLPATYALYATVFCLVVLSSGSLLSIWRHVYLIFPLFMVAARAGAVSALFDKSYVAVSLTLAGLLFSVLATGWNLVS